MATSPTPPPSFVASLPSWWVALLVAAVSALIGWGASKYEQGARDQAWTNKYEALEQRLTDLEKGPIAEYQADKRNRQIQDAQRLAAFEEAQAREYGRVHRLADQLQSTTKP